MANRKRSRPIRKKTINHVDRHHAFFLAEAMEGPLCRALAYAGAMELMGLGLNRLDQNHGEAVLAIAEAMTAELNALQQVWRQIATNKPISSQNTRQASHL